MFQLSSLWRWLGHPSSATGAKARFGKRRMRAHRPFAEMLEDRMLLTGPTNLIINTPPNLQVGQSATLGSSVTDSGLGAQPFTYTWSITQPAPGSTQAQLNGASTEDPVFTPDVSGPYTISLAVTDAAQQSVSSFTTLNVGPSGGGSGPTGIILGAPAGAQVGQVVTLGSTVTDSSSGAEPLQYAWNITPPGSTVSQSFSTDADPVFTPQTIGVYQFSLTVTDAQRQSGSSFVTLSVMPPPPPQLPPPPMNTPPAVGLGVVYFNPAAGPVTGQLAAVDPAGFPMTYQVVTPPSFGTVTVNADGSFIYTAPVSFIGTDYFNFTATDSRGLVPTLPR